MKKIGLKDTSKKEIEDEINSSAKSIKKLSNSLEVIKKEMNSLNPQSRLYFTNDLVANIFSYAELPPFILTSIIDGIKLVIQSQSIVQEEDKRFTSYVG